MTDPARRLAEQLGVSLDVLPRGRLVTEAIVRQHAAPTARPEARQVILFGAGGHAAVLIDLLRLTRTHDIEGLVDDGATDPVLGVPVLGPRACLSDLKARGFHQAINAIGGVRTLDTRKAVFALLAEQGFACPGLIHPRAVVDLSAVLGDGHQLLAQSYVGSRAHLGFGVIVNTAAVVSHDCRIGDYCHIAPGALLAGGVVVDHETIVGMGVTTAVGLRIGARCRIGNGVTLLADVPDNTMILAGTVWPRRA
jgi:UDP-perosamine 4-acetyltransferase